MDFLDPFLLRLDVRETLEILLVAFPPRGIRFEPTVDIYSRAGTACIEDQSILVVLVVAHCDDRCVMQHSLSRPVSHPIFRSLIDLSAHAQNRRLVAVNNDSGVVEVE